MEERVKIWVCGDQPRTIIAGVRAINKEGLLTGATLTWKTPKQSLRDATRRVKKLLHLPLYQKRREYQLAKNH